MSKNGNSSIRRFVDSSDGRMTGGRGDRATMLTCGRGGRAIPALLLTFSLFTFTFSLSAATRYWTGAGGNALASNAENWLSDKDDVTSIGAPETGDAVILDDGSAAMTWDAGMKDVKPASWAQNGYTGTVTFGTVFDTTGFTYAEITGDVTLNTGTWTHLGNTSTAVNRLYVKCGGDFTLGADGAISADGLGYGPNMNNDANLRKLHGFAWQDKTQGGSHGGHGGMANATTNFTYGCYCAPEDLGNAGRSNSSSADVPGGGAIRLDITGAFTCGRSVIVLNGTAVQTVSSASPLYGLTVAGPGADILTSLECSEFTAGGVAQTNLFADGSLFKAIVFKVDGDLTSAPVTLSSKTTSGAW